MKIRSILLSTLALATLASCSKDAVDSAQTTNLQTIDVVLPGNIKTLAVDDTVAMGTASTISDAIVFLMNGESVVMAEAFTSDQIAKKLKRFENVPGTINNVIVVANAQGQNLNALKTGISIRKYAFEIAAQQSSSAKKGIAHVTLMGEAVPASATDPTPDGHLYKQAAITLNALVARLEIGAVKPGTGIASVKLNAVFVNNYFKTGACVPGEIVNNLSAATVWDYTGTTNSANPLLSFTNAYTDPSYRELGSTEVTLAQTSKVYAFQVFAGNLPHVVLCVSGEFSPGYYDPINADNKYFTQWVTFTKYNTGTGYVSTFTGNNIYKIGVGLQGITITPEIMTPEPEQPQTDLGVNITVASWTLNNVTPEI